MLSKQRLRLKICGITRLEDALWASRLGVDALGFVFYEKSPRYINPAKAQEIIEQLPPFITVVGLFVNPSQLFIDDVLDVCQLDVLQLHGEETPAFCAVQSRRVIKAVPIVSAGDVKRIHDFNCTVLLDAKAPKDIYGGTGCSFDWNVLKGLQHHHPLILAGGVDVSNVQKALSIDNIYALDVSSGVESSKGIKDRQKMIELCELMN
ncbi:MAG: phosphoribosylanthranilate isomerase [Ghiorsea sp.]|nr:phosphoribosylanthranilate isomerase [Ghiorsea sp.]